VWPSTKEESIDRRYSCCNRASKDIQLKRNMVKEGGMQTMPLRKLQIGNKCRGGKEWEERYLAMPLLIIL
jgi:hypothetical protein